MAARRAGRGDPAAYARAHAAIARLQAARPGTYGQERIAGMRRILAYRERPADQLAALDRELAAPQPTAAIASAFRDFAGLAAKAVAKPRRRTGSRRSSRPIARRRWTRPRTLERDAKRCVAARRVEPGDARRSGRDGAGAGRGARSAGSVAWASAQYHLVRLTLARVDPAATRARIDAMLSRDDLTVSDRNVFLALRTQVSTDPGDFARAALRQPYCDAGRRIASAIPILPETVCSAGAAARGWGWVATRGR